MVASAAYILSAGAGGRGILGAPGEESGRRLLDSSSGDRGGGAPQGGSKIISLYGAVGAAGENF